MCSNLETLERRFLMSASAAVTTDQQTVAADLLTLASDKAALHSVATTDFSNFLDSTGSDDADQINSAISQLSYDSKPANGSNDRATLLADRQAVTAARAQLRADSVLLAYEILDDTAAARETIGNETAQLAYDRGVLAADQRGLLTSTITTDLANIQAVQQQIATDQFNFSEQVVTDQQDDGQVALDITIIQNAQFQLQTDSLPSDLGVDTAQLASDRQAITAAKLTLAQDKSAVIAQTRSDTVAYRGTLKSDKALMKTDKTTLAADLRAEA